VADRFNLLEREEQINPEKDSQQKRARAKDAPIVLKQLKVARPPNTYLLQISYRSTDPQVAADVANGVAQSYIEHTYNIRIRSSSNLSKFMERQLEELRVKMEASSAKLVALERELNVINPEEKTNILSARLLQLNSAFTTAQAERTRTESAYNEMKKGSVEAALASAQGDELRKLIARQNEASERFAEVRTHYGVNHPEYRRAAEKQRELAKQADDTRLKIMKQVESDYNKARDQEGMLERAVAETKAEYDKLNLRSFEYQRAKREADADKNLYEELVRKIREAGINAGFQNNTVRIADPARAGYRPVFPKLTLNLLLAFLFSSLLGIGVAVLSDALDNTIRDPEDVSRTLNTQIVGSLPEVKNKKELLVSALAAGQAQIAAAEVHSANGAVVKAADRRFSTYEEAIRTIRNSILLTDFDRRIKSLLFTSATASEGKSTTAAHVAAAHAEQGNRTLLVDCDLRRPSQHRIFGLAQGAGLSNVLNGEMGWRDAIVKPAASGLPLDLITAGPPSRRAADRIGTLLGEFMEEMAKEYDLIVLDAPPLLGFAESLQLAASADGVVVLTRAGETSRKAVAAALSTLAHLRAKVIGLVLNQVKKHHSDHYYYYGYYGKYYRKYQNAEPRETVP
jgi:capsular exopolysaccharide synthesis family protein